jgi:hypothetical protein
MTGDGTLAAEIQRKTDEIDSWPEWAKPYEHKAPTPPPSSNRPSSSSVHRSDADGTDLPIKYPR